MKTIGVIGGIGPQATMDFEARVHTVARDLLPPFWGGGYPPLLVYYHREAPMQLGSDGTPTFPLQLHPRLEEVARHLGAMADFLVITANGPHLLRSEVEVAAGRHVLSLIDVTLQEVAARQWRRVGVLGLGEPTVYRQPLEQSGLTVETLCDPRLQRRLDAAIRAVMEGRADDGALRAASTAVEVLLTRGVDGVILGCTELPFLLPQLEDEANIINPLQFLARETVRQAMT